MKKWRWARATLVVGLFALLTGPALADRTPIVRAEGQRFHGTRPDIRVPYYGSGPSGSAFGVYQFTGPLIYSAPTVDNPLQPGARPTYNLPFYGARMAFSGAANGAESKTTLLPPRRR